MYIQNIYHYAFCKQVWEDSYFSLSQSKSPYLDVNSNISQIIGILLAPHRGYVVLPCCINPPKEFLIPIGRGPPKIAFSRWIFPPGIALSKFDHLFHLGK